MKAKKPSISGGAKRPARASAAVRATRPKAAPVGPSAKAAGRSKAPKARNTSRSGSKARKSGGLGQAARRASVSDEIALEAAVLRRLLKHFDERKDVQNIELMILAGFCRNCLSKWLVEAAAERGLEVDIERAREKVYGMPYDEWKSRYQQPATEEQLQRFAAAEQRKQQR
jgi:hypothetical protein